MPSSKNICKLHKQTLQYVARRSRVCRLLN